MQTIPAIAGAILMTFAATSCKGRTTANVEPTGETIEVNPVEPAEADSAQPAEADSMNHDAEAVTLPDAIEVPE